MGIRKRFDRELYEQNDKRAKEAVIKYLGRNHWTENPKKRGPDLIHKRIEEKFAECEIKKKMVRI